MGLFEDTIAAGLADPEGREGWDEAEMELAGYYMSRFVLIGSVNTSNREREDAGHTCNPEMQYVGPVVSYDPAALGVPA